MMYEKYQICFMINLIQWNSYLSHYSWIKHVSLIVVDYLISLLLHVLQLKLSSKVRGHFTNMGYLQSQYEWVLAPIIKCGMKLIIQFQTSTMQPSRFLGMDSKCHATLYNGRNYLSLLGLKLIQTESVHWYGIQTCKAFNSERITFKWNYMNKVTEYSTIMAT